MSTFAEKAAPYVEMGWPVIPQSLDKVPLIKGWRFRRYISQRPSPSSTAIKVTIRG